MRSKLEDGDGLIKKGKWNRRRRGFHVIPWPGWVTSKKQTDTNGVMACERKCLSGA